MARDYRAVFEHERALFAERGRVDARTPVRRREQQADRQQAQGRWEADAEPA